MLKDHKQAIFSATDWLAAVQSLNNDHLSLKLLN